jgi:predicted Na+-dependent transporter
MSVNEFFAALATLSGVLFVTSSMLGMGMSLTVTQILRPLKKPGRVVVALAANFVLVPLLAWLITLVLPLDQPLETGLLILAASAGAPFLPKLVQGAKGDVAYAVGLMVLLMVTTVIYLPLVLPLLLQGVSVSAWDILKSLVALMLVPLAVGLLIRSNSTEAGERWASVMNKVSSIAMLALLVLGLGLNVSNIIDLVGSYGFLALLLLIGGALLIGALLGGRDRGARSVMALGTAQRNVSAAIVVASQNFAGTMTLPYVLVAAIVLLLVLLPVARRIGRERPSPVEAV